MIIDVFCKSGRHRSVGEATSLAIILQHLGIKFTLVHCEARERGRGWLTMHCGGGCNECGWFNDNAFDEVKEMLKPICNRIQQVVNRMPEYTSRRTVPTVDLTTSSAGSSSDVAALQNQVTKLTELVEKLASDKSTKGERSRRRRRSATRSRSRARRRGRARDVRDPSSRTRTPPRRPRALHPGEKKSSGKIKKIGPRVVMTTDGKLRSHGGTTSMKHLQDSPTMMPGRWIRRS